MAAAATSSRKLPSYESESDASSTEDVIREGNEGAGTVCNCSLDSIVTHTTCGAGL